MTEEAVERFRHGFPVRWKKAAEDAFEGASRRAQPTPPMAAKAPDAAAGRQPGGCGARSQPAPMAPVTARAAGRAATSRAAAAAGNAARPQQSAPQPAPTAARPPRLTRKRATLAPRDRLRRRVRQSASSLVAVPIAQFQNISKRLREDRGRPAGEPPPKAARRGRGRTKTTTAVAEGDHDVETELDDDEPDKPDVIPPSAIAAVDAIMAVNSPPQYAARRSSRIKGVGGKAAAVAAGAAKGKARAPVWRRKGAKANVGANASRKTTKKAAPRPKSSSSSELNTSDEEHASGSAPVSGKFSALTRRLQNARSKRASGKENGPDASNRPVTPAPRKPASAPRSKSIVRAVKNAGSLATGKKNGKRRVAFTDELDSVEAAPPVGVSSQRAARLAKGRKPKKVSGKAALLQYDNESSANASGLGTPQAPRARAWTAVEAGAYERMRNSVPGDRAGYWDAVAAGVPGRSADECHARWAASWVTPTKRAARPRSAAAASTPEIVAGIAAAPPSRAHMRTAKFAGNMRRVADAAARDADDDQFEPTLGVASGGSLTTTPRFAAGELPDGTPGTVVRERRRELADAAHVDTPEILARGKEVGLEEADRFVALFKKRFAKAKAKNKVAVPATREGTGEGEEEEAGPVARDLLDDINKLEVGARGQGTPGSEGDSPGGRDEVEMDPDVLF